MRFHTVLAFSATTASLLATLLATSPASADPGQPPAGQSDPCWRGCPTRDAGADKDYDANRTRRYVHMDVLPFTNGGFGVWAGLKPRRLKHWQFGVGLYQFNEPAGYVTFTDHANDGLKVGTFAAAAYANYYFGLAPIPSFGHRHTSTSGLFAGALVGYGRTSTQDPTQAGENYYDGISLGLQAGYAYYPFGRGLYLAPTVGAETTIRVASSGNSPRSYAEPPVDPLVFLNVGLQF